MRQYLIVISLFLFTYFFCVAYSNADTVYHPPDCGTNALYLLMRIQNSATGLSEIQAALPPPHELGYSMLELQSAGRRCGLDLVGEKFKPADVPLGSSVIAYRPGHKSASGHFVVIRPVGFNHTLVQVIDPPYAPQLIEYHALFGGQEQPIMILRPTSKLEESKPIFVSLLSALAFFSVLRLWLVRRQPGKPCVSSEPAFPLEK